jgi:hypothetical protein
VRGEGKRLQDVLLCSFPELSHSVLANWQEVSRRLSLRSRSADKSREREVKEGQQQEELRK